MNICIPGWSMEKKDSHLRDFYLGCFMPGTLITGLLPMLNIKWLLCGPISPTSYLSRWKCYQDVKPLLSFSVDPFSYIRQIFMMKYQYNYTVHKSIIPYLIKKISQISYSRESLYFLYIFPKTGNRVTVSYCQSFIPIINSQNF